LGFIFLCLYGAVRTLDYRLSGTPRGEWSTVCERQFDANQGVEGGDVPQWGHQRWINDVRATSLVLQLRKYLCVAANVEMTYAPQKKQQAEQSRSLDLF
jgi:hypothetical protein